MNEKLKKVLNTPLYDLNLNVRHINSLWKAHIKTIGQLIDFNHDIGCIRGINEKLVPNILEEIVRYINSEGLHAYIESDDYYRYIVIKEYEFACSYLSKILYCELCRLGIEYSDYVVELPKWPPYNLIELLGYLKSDRNLSTIKNIDELNRIIIELGLPKIYDEENGNIRISTDMNLFIIISDSISDNTCRQISMLNVSDEKMEQVINQLDNSIEENDVKVKVKKGS